MRPHLEVTGGLFPDRYGCVKELQLDQIDESKFGAMLENGSVTCKYMDQI